MLRILENYVGTENQLKSRCGSGSEKNHSGSTSLPRRGVLHPLLLNTWPLPRFWKIPNTLQQCFIWAHFPISLFELKNQEYKKMHTHR
jgi:hypothetical protein